MCVALTASWCAFRFIQSVIPTVNYDYTMGMTAK